MLTERSIIIVNYKMKQFAKRILASFLGWQVRRLRAKNDLKLIVVAGSIGKTSTKFAIASMLSQKYRVCYQAGNYNHIVTAPLVFFNQTEPSLFNVLAWLKVLYRNERLLRGNYPYDAVVLELGTDGPGQIAEFGAYINADIGVVTAIAPEHMESFKDLDAVAAEELSIKAYCQKLLINKDLCDPYYAEAGLHVETYGKRDTDFKLVILQFNQSYYDFEVSYKDKTLLTSRYTGVSEAELYSVLASISVAHTLGLDKSEILKGIQKIQPVAGRMRRLPGINNSLILDDTYNASPEATKAALKTLYQLDTQQRIAILGNMNELGGYSQSAHTEVGEFCDPTKLSLVVTLGPDANEYLATAASKRGCNVQTASSPYEAADIVKSKLKSGAIILAKGSQNGVFAEEAVKRLLANPADVQKLVRQSPEWLRTKSAKLGITDTGQN